MFVNLSPIGAVEKRRMGFEANPSDMALRGPIISSFEALSVRRKFG
jgi:hypothetical protein